MCDCTLRGGTRAAGISMQLAAGGVFDMYM